MALSIANQHFNCSYPMKETVWAASDTCQQPARSGVVSPIGGGVYWRCDQHAGHYGPGIRGEIVTEIPEPKIHNAKELAEFLSRHRAKNDIFDQNIDSWYCTCEGIRRYRSEAEVERHVAEEVFRSLDVQ